MRLKTNANRVAASACPQARRRRSTPRRPVLVGAQAAADPRCQDRTGRGTLLVAGPALRAPRGLLERHQFHHRAAIQLRRHHHRIPRPHSGHADWRHCRVCIFILLDPSMELHSCRLRRHRHLRPPWLPLQFAPRGSHHRHRDAGAIRLAQGSGLRSRAAGDARNIGGAGRGHAGLSRPRTSCLARWVGAGIPGAGLVL